MRTVTPVTKSLDLHANAGGPSVAGGGNDQVVRGSRSPRSLGHDGGQPVVERDRPHVGLVNGMHRIPWPGGGAR